MSTTATLRRALEGGPMNCIWRRTLVGEAQSAALGREVAQLLAVGDMVCLRGPVGAGKSVLARALIGALASGAAVEVPSPTFALVETYRDLRLPITHVDLYRIEDPDEVVELGLDEALDIGAVVVEWPEKLGAFLPSDYLEIALAEGPGHDNERAATLTGFGAWTARLARARAARQFIGESGWVGAEQHWLKGDASSRSYQRLAREDDSAILMDAPAMDLGPPVSAGEPYAKVAGLATSIHAFLAVNAHLRSLDLSVPQIYRADADQGFVLLEDFGDLSFDQLIAQGADLTGPYRAALAVLARMHEVAPPEKLVFEGGAHTLPKFGLRAMLVEVDLLVEWFWPTHFGEPCPAKERARYRDLWSQALQRLDTPSVLMLRDFHAPNLFWLPRRDGAAQIGIIDHQDACVGHPAYDLMSLAQDARNDLPPGFAEFLVEEYRALRHLAGGPGDRFGHACALLGAQRSAKILGGFVRLGVRDGKFSYFDHIPRIARYLAANLAHPELGDLRGWFEAKLDLPALARTGLNANDH
ncbi:MAG: tRNA (adenosine(37)-N6)-threonylcarbamoyltransferase complex ATPase subunit type 1 TsaE [Alphaproteobacteria bacterium]